MSMPDSKFSAVYLTYESLNNNEIKRMTTLFSQPIDCFSK